MTRLSTEERFWAKVDKNGPLWNGTPCWLWLAYKDAGYGRFWLSPNLIQAHRFAYELLVGPIPEELQIDHLCRNHTCVNPAHMEAVSHRINNLRGNGLGAQGARKTHCPQGHSYDLLNTYFWQGGRHCRACGRVAALKYWRKSG